MHTESSVLQNKFSYSTHIRRQQEMAVSPEMVYWVQRWMRETDLSLFLPPSRSVGVFTPCGAPIGGMGCRSHVQWPRGVTGGSPVWVSLFLLFPRPPRMEQFLPHVDSPKVQTTGTMNHSSMVVGGVVMGSPAYFSPPCNNSSNSSLLFPVQSPPRP